MALSDYAHWNEDARMMWWQEEGRFEGTVEPDYDPYDDDYGYYDEDDEDEDGEPYEYVREDFGWDGGMEA